MMNNLKLEFGEKSLDYIGDQPHRTRVVLTNDDGAYYPIFFDPGDIEKPNAELYDMALEVVYEKNAYQRAENEKFNLLGEKIAEVDRALERSKEQQDKVDEMLKVISGTLNEIISQLPESEG